MSSERSDVMALAVGTATLTVAGCATFDMDQELPKDVDIAATERYNNLFIYPATGRVDRARSIEFFWSPTCRFSAKMYGEKIVPLLRDEGVARNHNIGFFQISRNELDTQYFAVMRSFVEYPELCEAVLAENYSRGKQLTLIEVVQLASAAGFTRQDDYVLADAVSISKISTNILVDERNLKLTPTLLLGGRSVTLA